MTVLALTLLSVGLHFRINDSATGCSLKKELRATRKHTIASKFTPTSNQESVLPRMVTQLPSFKQCTQSRSQRLHSFWSAPRMQDLWETSPWHFDPADRKCARALGTRLAVYCDRVLLAISLGSRRLG